MSRRTKLMRKQRVLSRLIDAVILGDGLVVSARYGQAWLHDRQGTVFFQWYLPNVHGFQLAKSVNYKEAADLVEAHWSKRNYVGRTSIT